MWNYILITSTEVKFLITCNVKHQWEKSLAHAGGHAMTFNMMQCRSCHSISKNQELEKAVVTRKHSEHILHMASIKRARIEEQRMHACLDAIAYS